ncbi:uncharacterized protein FOMMEDRAFT_160036 [Fomitiporia mediterranea MF3/22]|uniref:uncharacterized protein n=1 Tax=Fomitiporia mediterranea (strain MF3/22) TaxID=694068 RepID=UPI000440985A|nr:uncharacterized protein FOMMEDRAFT_160036 [Fomitiporia mediterranea MF3/22]EJC99612.1 hypothetical protein FOMMEDRAFT_160036 [Fomitiporia mediterranea MF3/22]
MHCVEDELGLIPSWNPSPRNDEGYWRVTQHYFASYARRSNKNDANSKEEDGTVNVVPTALVAVVNRYVPRAEGLRTPVEGGITLVLAHSLGSHKEIWEPLLAHLLLLDKQSNTSRLISEIWSFEPVHHGDSALLNGNGLLEVDPMNYPVDLVEFLRRRMPKAWDPSVILPTHLPRHGISDRPNVVGIGHSIGGSSFVHAGLQMPKALKSLIVIEPFLVNPEKNIPKAYAMVSAGTARQPEEFSSRLVQK